MKLRFDCTRRHSSTLTGEARIGATAFHEAKPMLTKREQPAEWIACGAQ